MQITENKRVLFLGAESCGEFSEEPWIYDSTPEEIAEFKSAVLQSGITESQFDSLGTDKTGRPYWIKTITNDAPDYIWVGADDLRRLRF